MIDVKKYLGLSYDINNEFGVNCWGLYKLIQKQERGIEVVMFSAMNSSIRAISDKFKSELKLNKHGHKKVVQPENLDLVVMLKPMKRASIYHCGVYVDGKVLHAKGEGQGGQVWLEDIGSLSDWRMEYWRHV
jgi:hypothetical protein